MIEAWIEATTRDPEAARLMGMVVALAGEVEFEAVSFSYREGMPVLREVSLQTLIKLSDKELFH